MLVLAPLLYSLFIFSHASPILAAPIPTSSYAGYEQSNQGTFQEHPTSHKAPNKQLVRRLAFKLNWKPGPQFGKHLAAVGIIGLLSGLLYMSIDNPVKKFFGLAPSNITSVALPLSAAAPRANQYAAPNPAPAYNVNLNRGSSSTAQASSQSSGADDLTAWVNQPQPSAQQSRKRSLVRRGAASAIKALTRLSMFKGTFSQIKEAAIGSVLMVGAFSAIEDIMAKKNSSSSSTKNNSQYQPHAFPIIDHAESASSASVNTGANNEYSSVKAASQTDAQDYSSDYPTSQGEGDGSYQATNRSDAPSEAVGESAGSKHPKQDTDEENQQPVQSSGPLEAIQKRGMLHRRAFDAVAEEGILQRVVTKVKGKFTDVWHSANKPIGNTQETVANLAWKGVVGAVVMVGVSAVTVKLVNMLFHYMGLPPILQANTFKKKKRSLPIEKDTVGGEGSHTLTLLEKRGAPHVIDVPKLGLGALGLVSALVGTVLYQPLVNFFGRFKKTKPAAQQQPPLSRASTQVAVAPTYQTRAQAQSVSSGSDDDGSGYGSDDDLTANSDDGSQTGVETAQPQGNTHKHKSAEDLSSWPSQSATTQ